MASRYLPQQQLIGPSLYPYYRQALVLVVFWVVLPIALFGGAIAAIYSEHPAAMWPRVLGSAWNGGIYAVGIVTIVFAVLERERVRITALDNWNPARLPDPADGRTVPRSETIPGLVATLTFLVWWTEIVRVPIVHRIRRRDDPLRGGADLGAGLLARADRGARRHRHRAHRPGAAVADAGRVDRRHRRQPLQRRRSSSSCCAPVASSTCSAMAAHAQQVTRASYWINASLSWTFTVLAAVILLDVLYEIWKVARARQSGTLRAV